MQSKSEQRNREAWLTDAMALLLPVIKQRTGLSPQKPIKVSVGFAATGGRRRKNGSVTAGQCCMREHSKYHQVFIHPMYDESRVVEMVGTLTHEMLHGCLDMHVGHRKAFSQAARKLGLTGKPTHAGLKPKPDEDEQWSGETQALVDLAKTLTDELGPYPQESLELEGKKQSTRLLKASCIGCGYVVRVTRTWLDVGAPICPQCLIEMEEGGEGGEMTNPLVARSNTVEYVVKATSADRKLGFKFDPRFLVRMGKQGRDVRWWIVDYGASEGDYVHKADGTLVTDPDGNPVRKAVLGIVRERLFMMESREDAIANIEALQAGTLDPDELAKAPVMNDDDPALDGDEQELAGEYGEDDSDVGDELTPDEQAEYDQQEREFGCTKVTPRMIDFDLDKRIAELERLGGAA